jgi:hypothetical protein
MQVNVLSGRQWPFRNATMLVRGEGHEGKQEDYAPFVRRRPIKRVIWVAIGVEIHFIGMIGQFRLANVRCQ